MNIIGSIIVKDGIHYLVIDKETVAEIAYFDYIDGKKTPILRTEVTTKVEGIDEQGNKKISTNVNVKCFKIDLEVKR